MDASVIVPLYVYPALGAWDPVYNIAATYPQVQFTAIVNVHDGPSQDPLPNAEYMSAIQALNSFDNIRTIGYVSTTWSARDLNSVLSDVAAYSYWGENYDSLAMNGIFVDETPTRYSLANATYLQTIMQAVHASPGLHDNFIVHNPGALPDPEYFNTVVPSGETDLSANLTVVFENTYLNWTLANIQLAEVTESYDRDKLAVMVHSTPDLTTTTIKIVLRQMLAVGRSIWMTGSSNYTEFDDQLPIFVDRLAALLS